MGSVVLSSPMKYPYSTNSTDFYCTLGCSGTVFGYVRYQADNHVARIMEIEVAPGWRGHGWAGVMLRELGSRYGSVSFEGAMFTKDGRCAFCDSTGPALPGEWSFYDFVSCRVRPVPDGLL